MDLCSLFLLLLSPMCEYMYMGKCSLLAACHVLGWSNMLSLHPLGLAVWQSNEIAAQSNHSRRQHIKGAHLALSAVLSAKCMRIVRTVQLFGRVAILETHTL